MHEKISSTEAGLKKGVAYKKKRVHKLQLISRQSDPLKETVFIDLRLNSPKISENCQPRENLPTKQSFRTPSSKSLKQKYKNYIHYMKPIYVMYVL